MALSNFLYNILGVSGPSGSEGPVIELFHKFITPFVGECYTDVNGNFIAHKKGDGKKVMLVAHADEIGLMVSYIDDNGFLYFKEIGGIDTNLLPGRKVRIEGVNGPVIGVIGKKPIHLQEKSEGTKELNAEDLWIDIAASGRSEAESKVEIGSVATTISSPELLANDIWAAKSFDDRIGLYVLAGVASSLKETNADLYFVASVQEELGARGAQTVTESVSPDVGIAIDVTHATDYPSMSPAKYGDIGLGKGVVIAVGPNMTKQVYEDLKKTAIDSGIPYQVEALARPTGTDARMIQVSGTGVLTGLLSVPCRYMHTPNELISIKDADFAIRLVVEYLKKHYI